MVFAINTVYLGIKTPATSQYEPAYGWALLRQDAERLDLIDSAMTYSDTGIVVRTMTTIPEPGSSAFLISAVSAVLCVGLIYRSKRWPNKTL